MEQKPKLMLAIQKDDGWLHWKISKKLCFIFQLTIVAKDVSAQPKAATASVVITIVRNQYAPTFNQTQYKVHASDKLKSGTVLERLPATDLDKNIPLSANVSIFLGKFERISLFSYC